MHSLGCRSCAQCSPGCWCSLGWALLAFRLLQPLWGTPLASRVCAGFGGLLADLLYVGVSGTALSLPSPKFMTVLVKSDQKSAALWGYVPISVLWAGGAFCDPRENITLLMWAFSLLLLYSPSVLQEEDHKAAVVEVKLCAWAVGALQKPVLGTGQGGWGKFLELTTTCTGFKQKL